MDNVEGLQTRIPDNSIDLTVTSPPYDNLRDYEGYDFDYKPIAKQLYRVTKEGGVVVWVVSDQTIDGSETLNSFRQALYFVEKIGFNMHDTMIYKKKGCSFPDHVRYYNIFEYMFVFSKGKPKNINLIKDRKNKNSGVPIWGTTRNKEGTTKDKSGKGGNRKIKQFGVRYNIWEYPASALETGDINDIKLQHPATFPEKLAKDHIKSWSNKGDIVLDPFIGSGTTAKMAELLNRKWIGFEISQEYVDIAYKRVGKLDKQYYEELPEEKKPKQAQLF